VPSGLTDACRDKSRHATKPGPELSRVCLLPAQRRCIETGESKVILTTLCGHGHFDMSSYEKFLSGSLEVGSWALAHCGGRGSDQGVMPTARLPGLVLMDGFHFTYHIVPRSPIQGNTCQSAAMRRPMAR
jgi:hypothetical protein